MSTPAFVAAVASAGALGMLAAVGTQRDALVEQIRGAVRGAGPAAKVGVGFLVPFLDLDAFEADAGCDLVVVQGVEAGGHVRGTTPLRSLLTSVRQRIDVPLVSSGGIGTGVEAFSALQHGADAVRIGTRLLAADEADVHPGYLSALIAATAAAIVEELAGAMEAELHASDRS